MSTKLGVNPFDTSKPSQRVVFPGDALPASNGEAPETETHRHTPEQEQEQDMAARRNRSKTKNLKNSVRIPRNRQELLKALQTVRRVDAVEISKKLWSCRMERFSLIQFSASGRTPTLSLIGLDISHGFSLKNRTYKVGPVETRGWKVTLLDLQLRKGE